MKVIIFLLILLTIMACFFYQDGRVRINNERAGFFLLRGGYRAWWIRYSNGMTWDNQGKLINLWCKPRFEHCDVRGLTPSK